MRFILLFLLIYSCQIDNGFQDLTPKDNFGADYFFNAPAFTEALNNIGKSDSDGDTLFNIRRPEYLLPAPLHTTEVSWVSTDTFAFESQDFQQVLNLITHTAEIHSREIQSSVVSSKLGIVYLNGQMAWSVPGEYYLVPYNLANGERIYIQISRTKKSGGGFLSSWYYTANGLWMIGKENRSVRPGLDVS
ncbi:MAG TPA: hypothetical protein VKZ54_13310 [Membranihabitans sp.]|nr:hypothetical protein [Membranihabitans sp.]